MKAISIFALVIALAQSALALPTPDSRTAVASGSGKDVHVSGSANVEDAIGADNGNSNSKSAPQDLTNPFSPRLESDYTKDTEANASAEATAAFRREFFDHSHGQSIYLKATCALNFCMASSQRRQRDDEDDAFCAADMLLLTEYGDLARLPRRSQPALTRKALVASPRNDDTAWQVLYHNGDDVDFLATMGFDRGSFGAILNGGFADHWNAHVLYREDNDPEGQARLGARSLDAAGVLGLCLHYINSTMRLKTLQQIFGLTPAVCSRYLGQGQSVLLHTLRGIAAARILWPNTLAEYERYSALITARADLLQGAFGFVDGLKLPIMTSGVPDIENAYYNGWTCAHYISNVLTFAPDGTIIHAVLNSPGSWHDAAVSRPLFALLQERRHEHIPYLGEQRRLYLQFQKQLVSQRQAAEWGMRALQGSFGRLKLPLQSTNDHNRLTLLEVCVRLHNLRTRLLILHTNELALVAQELALRCVVSLLQSVKTAL
ncbi:hypothetical protein RI367_006405 [Sorochytrium milnesiophthora]